MIRLIIKDGSVFVECSQCGWLEQIRYGFCIADISAAGARVILAERGWIIAAEPVCPSCVVGNLYPMKTVLEVKTRNK